jgi:hypothetical protein
VCDRIVAFMSFEAAARGDSDRDDFRAVTGIDGDRCILCESVPLLEAQSDRVLGYRLPVVRRRDGVVTRVRKAAAVGLITPIAAAALAVGVGPSASAAGCPPLGNATITPPSGTVIAGSSVHVSAQISGLMLLQAHLQISGPGLDQQVGKSVMTGKIQGDVTVPKPGAFTLAVIGNGTKCTYQTQGFSVKARPSPKPTHSADPTRTPAASGGASSAGGGSLPKGSVGNGAAPGGYGLNPLNGASPFSLPSVAPDGSALGFAYPTPDPQVASPPSQPVAQNVSQRSPVKWGQSLAIALVLLVISAHLGMWSRRQRLAAEGAGGRGLLGRKKATETMAKSDGGTSAETESGEEASDGAESRRRYEGRRRRG